MSDRRRGPAKRRRRGTSTTKRGTPRAGNSVSDPPTPVVPTRLTSHADRAQWPAMAAFARRRSHVDSQAMTRYPLLPLPTSHAAQVLGAQIPPLEPRPAAMPMDAAIGNLARGGLRFGMMVL
jgi:hypothetical protein